MIVLSAFCILLIAAAAVAPTILLRKLQNTNWWDYAYPLTGVIAWFSLAMARIGSTVTLSNFVIEVFSVAAVSMIILWVRWFLARLQNGKLDVVLYLMTFLPITLALVIRLSMPSLPE
jgi:hypothetical protein